MSTTNTKPSHKVYAVTKGKTRNFWQEIGAAWPHADGKGFNVKLDYLPLNGAEISIREPKAKVEEGGVQ
jgi:predicted ABC-type ATPase